MARPRRRPTRLLLALGLLLAAAALACVSGRHHSDGYRRHRLQEGSADLARRSRRALGGSIGRAQAAVGIDAGPQAGEVELDGALLGDRRPARRLQVRLHMMTRQGWWVDWG